MKVLIETPHFELKYEGTEYDLSVKKQNTTDNNADPGVIVYDDDDPSTPDRGTEAVNSEIHRAQHPNASATSSTKRRAQRRLMF